MKKLRLNLEALDVQSFDTMTKETPRGTVVGASPETFEAGCSIPWDACTGTCTAPTQPVPLCASDAGEVCPSGGSV